MTPDDDGMKRFDEYNREWWAKRSVELKAETKREEWGITYFLLATLSVLGGLAGLIYGLAGKGWVQKPYIVMGIVMLAIGLVVIIGGFGKVKR